MTVELESICVGPLEVNCYIVGCTEHKICAVIDPGDSSTRILKIVEEKGWKIKLIINTHGHADHSGASAKVKLASGAPIFIHKGDAEMLTHEAMSDMAAYLGIAPSPPADELLEDGQELALCEHLTFKVLHTPGHSPGGVCLLFGNNLITGDTLFRMTVGRTDLPGGSFAALKDSIMNKIFPLPPETVIYPGHGDSSTVGNEKSYNPFLYGGFK